MMPGPAGAVLTTVMPVFALVAFGFAAAAGGRHRAGATVMGSTLPSLAGLSARVGLWR